MLGRDVILTSLLVLLSLAYLLGSFVWLGRWFARRRGERRPYYGLLRALDRKVTVLVLGQVVLFGVIMSIVAGGNWGGFAVVMGVMWLVISFSLLMQRLGTRMMGKMEKWTGRPDKRD